MARWQRSWTGSWWCYPRTRRLNVHSGMWAKPWNHQLVHVLPPSITMTCHQHPYKSMTTSCTFKYMNANIRPLKHNVHTQQPNLVAYVFKTMQPQYLSRTIDMANYYAINSVRRASMYFEVHVLRFERRQDVRDFSEYGDTYNTKDMLFQNTPMLLMCANNRWKVLPVTRLLCIFKGRHGIYTVDTKLHRWHLERAGPV